jgi:hypothetical protein
MKHESTKYSVTKDILEIVENQPKLCLAYLNDPDAAFEDEYVMNVCADLAGVPLLTFWEHHGREAHHALEYHQFVLDQVDGMQPRTMRNDMKEESPSEAVSTAEWNAWVENAYGDKPRAAAEMKEEETEVDHYVAGKHYNDVVPGMQYMEMMQYMLADKTGVEAHLFGQIYKYLMRAGKKDNYEQDLRKANWYTTCLVKFIQTGEISVDNE